MGLALCLAVVVVAGSSFSALLRPRLGLVLAVALGVGLGLGASSVTWFLWLLLIGPPATGYVGAEIALFAALTAFCLLARRRSDRDPALPSPTAAPANRLLRRVLAGCLALLVVSSLVAFAVRWSAEPHGHWDAFSIWNLRARFLYRGGEHWQDGSAPALDWSHPDYPLLIPASVARCWTYLGNESTLAPALIGLLFTLATAGGLGAVVGALRTPTQGLLAALVLLGTRVFLMIGYWQIADVPLAFFMLAAVGLLCLHDRPGGPGKGGLILAGMMAGFAAWTKNEGLLFLACLLPVRLAVRGFAVGWREALREMLPLLLGLLPVALQLVYFKVCLAPPNDLVAGQGSHSTLSRLTDPARYGEIARASGKEFLTAIGPGAVLVLALAFVLLGRAPRAARPAAALPLLVLVLMLLGYFAVYLTTPHDLAWHLMSSLHRLYIQLWPLALLGYFSIVATPEEAAARGGDKLVAEKARQEGS
jgi:hypothetical protein